MPGADAATIRPLRTRTPGRCRWQLLVGIVGGINIAANADELAIAAFPVQQR